MDVLEAPIETPLEEQTPQVPNRGTEHPDFVAHKGKGRPKGSVNKLTQERYEFIELVVGKENSIEREDFAASIRRQIMAGTCAPQIALFFLQHWLGVPKAKIELSGSVGVQKIVREIIDAPQLPETTVIDVTPTPTPDPVDGTHTD